MGWEAGRLGNIGQCPQAALSPLSPTRPSTLLSLYKDRIIEHTDNILMSFTCRNNLGNLELKQTIKINFGARKMISQLTAYPEELSLLPRTYTEQLTIAYNSNHGIWCPLVAFVSTCTRMCTHTHIYIQLKRN